MKRVRFTTVLLTIALSLTILAQKTYLPMLEEGRKWNLAWLHPWDASGEYREGYYEIGPGLWYKGSEEQLSIQGDTVFDGRIYKPVSPALCAGDARAGAGTPGAGKRLRHDCAGGFRDGAGNGGLYRLLRNAAAGRGRRCDPAFLRQHGV